MNFSQIKHGHRQTNGIALHVVEAGTGFKSILSNQMEKVVSRLRAHYAVGAQTLASKARIVEKVMTGDEFN